MKNSYLVQRLLAPFDDPKTILEEFLAGLTSGGFGVEGRKIINKIMRFDYMGSAEYEFGAVPQAFTEYLKNIETYVRFPIEVPFLGDNPLRFHRNPKKRKTDPITGTATVYVICQKGTEDEVVSRIRVWATHHYPQEAPVRTKEIVGLGDSLALRASGSDDGYCRYAGWFDLTNYFFFFVDKDMYDNFVQLIPVPEAGYVQDPS